MHPNPFYKDGKLYRQHKNGNVNELKAVSVINGVPYIQFTKDYKRHLAHRYIYQIHFGEIPKGYVIDHINGNSTDNRIENLRCVTQSQNLLNLNSRKRSNNTSGYRGVSFKRKLNKWIVQACVNGKRFYIGSSPNKQTAIQMRRQFDESNPDILGKVTLSHEK